MVKKKSKIATLLILVMVLTLINPLQIKFVDAAQNDIQFTVSASNCRVYYRQAGSDWSAENVARNNLLTFDSASTSSIEIKVMPDEGYSVNACMLNDTSLDVSAGGVVGYEENPNVSR